MAITLEPPATGSLSATVPAEVWAELEAELAPVVPPRPTDEVAAGLAFVREQRRIADQAEVRLLEGVVQLAMLHQDLHPEHDVDLVIDYIGQDGVLPLAGPGAPHVSEFWLADLATTLRMSPAAAHTLAAEALELAFRLPRCWARVQAGRLPVWRARRIAAATIVLSERAAAEVDTRICLIAATVGKARLDQVITEVTDAVDPEAADQRHENGQECTRVLFSDAQVNGTIGLWATMDALDGLTLDKTLDEVAAQLALAGDERSRDQRRATALGLLANPQHALALLTERPEFPEDTALSGRRSTSVAVNLVLHLDPASPLARSDSIPGLVQDTVQRWCGKASTKVTVTPVIDLAATVTSIGYQPSNRLRDQVALRDQHCVFPWCERRGKFDLDHITPYDSDGPPGQTNTANLARLCRFHHRIKTHGHWFYRRDPDDPGAYLWYSDTGTRFRVRSTGTTELTPIPPPEDYEIGLIHCA